MKMGMRQNLLGVALLLFATQQALSQPAPTPSLAQALHLPAEPPPPPASAPAEDIQSLKASMLHLQERLDQLTLPPAAKGGTDWPLSAGWNNQLQFFTHDDSFRVH